MQKIFLALILVSFFFSCNRKSVNGTINVVAEPIDARLEGDYLKGPSVLQIDGYFVWGGSVIKGADGKYHMIFSCWESGPGKSKFTEAWVLSSKLGYAVSDFPDRDFKFQNIILKGRGLEDKPTAWDAQTIHNPHLKYFEGKYYLYFIASVDPGENAPGGKDVDLRNRVQQNQKIGVIKFDNFQDLLDGNFVRPDKPLLEPRTRVKPDKIVSPSPAGTIAKPDNIVVVNPAVVYRPSDKKYLLYFKGNQYLPDWRGIHGLAISDKPDGPFITQDDVVFDVKTQDGLIASTEDPFVWYAKKYKRFFAVFKDFTGAVTGKEPGLAIMESVDGVKWTLPENSFFSEKKLTLKGTGSLKVDRFERPQLLISEDGIPQVLYVACSVVDVNPRNDGTSFNVQIPLEKKE